MSNVTRYLRWQPDGNWACFIDGEIAGMVTLLRYGTVGFVGCMAVAPEHRSRGLGRTLLEHAHAAGRRAGVTTFLLEATEAGRPLYEKLGYVVEHETQNLGRPAAAVPTERISIAGELPAILALDREATGCDRGVMVSSLVADHPGAVAHAGDRLAGYGLAVEGRLGPVIARDPGAGRAVIDQLAPSCTLASVPVGNAEALAAVAAHGFTLVRALRRMRLGPPVPTPGWLWLLASPGAG